MANGNSVAAKFWVPILVMVFVTCASIAYGILQASSIARLEPVCDQVDLNTAALHLHERTLDVIQVRLETIIEKQTEQERRMSELVKGVNELAKRVQ